MDGNRKPTAERHGKPIMKYELMRHTEQIGRIEVVVETLADLDKEIDRLSKLTAPTTKDKTNLATFKSAVSTFSIGIKNANTNIKNLKANLILLTSQQSNKSTVESLKSDVDQASNIRTQSCAKGV